MLDHFTLPVGDFERSKKFFAAALAPLDYELLMEFGPSVAGFGVKPKPDFWINTEPKPVISLHLAFRAKDRAAVRAFYEAALAAGGKDDGPPGPRPMYHENYYGAFVLCPDGHSIEACCHTPEP